MSPADWWTLPGAPPLHATRRDPDRHTEGGRVAVIAAALGTPLLPWQRYAADVAGELNIDGSYRYPVVVVSVPRQSGKTTLMRAVGVDRCLSRPDLGVFYTAQTGKDARERWTDLVQQVTSSPLATLAVVRKAAGNERIVFANGSMFRCFAPVATSLHGYTPPLVMLDEAFAHDEATGDDLMGAIGPAQITLPHRQLWIVSTAGTASSVFLRRWIEAGRAGTAGVAHLEWAAGPEVADIYDPAVWPSFHPAMVESDGRQLVTVEAVRAEADRLPRSEFERAYGNRWTRTASHLIPATTWDALADPGQRPLEDWAGAAGAYCLMPDGVAAAVVVAWRDGAGMLQAKVARSGPGAHWVAETVAALRAAGVRTWAEAGKPARTVTDELGHPEWLRKLTSDQWADSWGALMRHLVERTMRHDGSEALAIGAANVATRPVGDASGPSLRHSAGDVSALVALMVATWAESHRAPDAPLQYRFADA